MFATLHNWAPVDAMRERYEADPTVTCAQLGELAGLDALQVLNYIRRKGWVRSPEVIRQSRKISGAIGLEVRRRNAAEREALRKIAASLMPATKPVKHKQKREKAPSVAPPDTPANAVTSVFDLGSGRRVTTNRNHEEIQL